jgi:hypothetical protein
MYIRHNMIFFFFIGKKKSAKKMQKIITITYNFRQF